MTMSSGVEILWTKMTSIKVEMHNLSVCSVVTFCLFLFSFGASEAEWVELCPHNSRSHSVCCWSMCCYCTGSVADSENQSRLYVYQW